MAQRSTYPSKAFTREQVKFDGQITFAAADTVPTSVDGVTGTQGQGFTVAKIGTGHIRITLADQWAGLVDVVPAKLPADALGTMSSWVLTADAVVASKTFDLKYVEQDATPAVAHPAAGDKLYLAFTVRNSTVRR